MLTIVIQLLLNSKNVSLFRQLLFVQLETMQILDISLLSSQWLLDRRAMFGSSAWISNVHRSESVPQVLATSTVVRLRTRGITD